MDLGGPYALFLYFAVWSAGLVVFVLHRQRRRAQVEQEEKTVFVPIAATTPAALELDPWTDAAESSAREAEEAEANADAGTETEPESVPSR